MTQTTNKNDERAYPSAFYAAAGVGDLAYQQLRRLPEVADKLRDKAAEFADRAASTSAPQWKAKANEYGALATSKAAELTAKVDPVVIRDSIVTGTQQAAEKAAKFYDTLVTRGEQAFAQQPAESEPAAAQAPAEDVPPAAKPAAKRTTPKAK
ncbi:hypothetical protein [Catellatospora sp. TT07R-123]|uniref:hypothetical protein n=1 Tax=Catellatospora sp. TT07R-123 TaxID=2733863 RepID=UPI001BB36546|nr:hypothetical protein [Catellatospora sp. TT07R-123]